MANDMAPTPTPSGFDPTTFFAGRTRAHGVFEDRFGRARRRFRADIDGRWDDDVFVLDEMFAYDDGSVEQRTWRLTRPTDGRFTATCPDCLGVAKGELSADGWRMRYRFHLRLGGRTATVTFDDRLYRTGNGVAINRATLRKFGVVLGDALIVFEKAERQGRAFADAEPAFNGALRRF